MISVRPLLSSLFMPGWWVCEYASQSGNYSGEFPAIGPTREDAWRDAKAFLERNALINGTLYFRLRKPSIIERVQSIGRV